MASAQRLKYPTRSLAHKRVDTMEGVLCNDFVFFKDRRTDKDLHVDCEECLKLMAKSVADNRGVYENT